MRTKIYMLIINVIKYFYRIKGMIRKYDAITFHPHSSMAMYDLYDVINYKSDSAYSFFHYIVTHQYLKSYKLFVITSDTVDIERLHKYALNELKAYNIEFIPYYIVQSKPLLERLRITANFFSALSRSEYIFTSTTLPERDEVVSKQMIVNLGYFTAPFKNDIFPTNSPFYQGIEKEKKRNYRYVCTSELSIRLILSTYGFKYDQYLNLGMCRNDYLVSANVDPYIRESIINDVPYKVERIVLYIPTHKDYDKGNFDAVRSLMGFETANIEEILKEKGILILCKVHPKQNTAAFRQSLPECIKIHEGNANYGLAELMQISDALMTDYTSGYFDYLLLDKPVIFNFFDYDLYNSTRGFTYDPIESIIAGDIIKDEMSLYQALENIDNNARNFAAKRAFLRDMFFTYQDNKSCERVYEYFFEKAK